MSNSQLRALATYVKLFNTNAASHILRAAHRLGILDALYQGQKTAEQLAQECNLDADALRLLLGALIRTGLIEQYGDQYALSQVARLIPDTAADFGDRYWRHLESFVRTGVSLPEQDQELGSTAEFFETALATEWLQTPAALDVATALDIGVSRTGLRILDAGCGAAVFSMTLAHRDPTCHVTLVDDRLGLDLGLRTARSIGVESRVEPIEANYLDVDLPDQSFDLVLLSGRIHRHPIDECRRGFAHLRQMLESRGEMAVIDVFPGQPQGDTTRSIFQLELALRLPTGRVHPPDEVRAALLSAGLENIQFAHLPAPPHIWGLVLSQRVA